MRPGVLLAPEPDPRDLGGGPQLGPTRSASPADIDRGSQAALALDASTSRASEQDLSAYALDVGQDTAIVRLLHERVRRVRGFSRRGHVAGVGMDLGEQGQQVADAK